MGLANVVPLTEADTFTFGCAVLRTRWFDPERISFVLVAIAALLVVRLLIVLTPEQLAFDTSVFDPAAILPLTLVPGSP